MTALLSTDKNPPQTRNRFDGIDLLRGVVMVIMALDHCRGNFTNFRLDPTNLNDTTPAMFLTRWLTHYCAPTFVFLAGTGAFLYGRRCSNKFQLSWFLLSRGLWLVFLELTVIRFSWISNFDYSFAFGQVIWAIGWSMVVLALLVFLPISVVTSLGIVMIVFHNLFDGIKAEDCGDFGWLWIILHTGQHLTDKHLSIMQSCCFHPIYPLIPWIGVMAAGYGFGALWLLEPKVRRREILGLGLALTLTFVALRYTNLYGDKVVAAKDAGIVPGSPWKPFDSPWYTIFSFINCQKYPPALLFLLMTLGPAIAATALFDRPAGPVGRFFLIYGRVPLFFYLLHWYLLRLTVLAIAYARFGHADWYFENPPKLGMPDPRPLTHGFDLWAVYLIWIAVVLALYYPCRWFESVKRRRKDFWLSYL